MLYIHVAYTCIQYVCHTPSGRTINHLTLTHIYYLVCLYKFDSKYTVNLNECWILSLYYHTSCLKAIVNVKLFQFPLKIAQHLLETGMVKK